MSELPLPDKPDEQKPALTDQERTQLTRMLSFPLELPPDFITYIEGRMRLLLEADNILGLAQRLATVGELKIIAKDLTAETGAYIWNDAQGDWYYCNGATFSSTDYPDLNTFLGGTTLPDARGRSIWMCGTNAATNLLDNDGEATVANRQVKHTHTDSIAITGSVTGTFVTSVTPTYNTQFIEGASNFVESISAPTGSVSDSLGIGGSVGSGMSASDAIAHVFVGSLLIHV